MMSDDDDGRVCFLLGETEKERRALLETTIGPGSAVEGRPRGAAPVCVRGVVGVGERQNDPMMTLLLLVSSGFRFPARARRRRAAVRIQKVPAPNRTPLQPAAHTPRQIIANASLTS